VPSPICPLRVHRSYDAALACRGAGSGGSSLVWNVAGQGGTGINLSGDAGDVCTGTAGRGDGGAIASVESSRLSTAGGVGVMPRMPVRAAMAAAFR
jgi:hypothetical protein